MNKIIPKTGSLIFLLFVVALPAQASDQAVLGFFDNKELPTILETKRAVYNQNKKSFFRLKDLTSTKNVFTRSQNQRAEIENPLMCQEKISLLSPCLLTDDFASSIQIQKLTEVLIEKNKLNAFLDEIVNKFEEFAIEPTFRFEETTGQLTLLKKGVNGKTINVEETSRQITTSLASNIEQTEIPLTLKIAQPKVKDSDFEKLNIKEKVATGSSNFRRSPQNRVFNINNALKRFQGVLIAPQEEFSFVKTLGPVDAATGYKEELVIKNNETIPEFGGGICQVSTTLFRAAINAGLKITERRSHAYPVQYYAPQGTDATIYIPHPDLRFVNNTPSYLLLQPKVEGSILTFDIYGINDGRKVTVGKPVVTKRDKENKTFHTSLKQTVLAKDGTLILEKTFRSFYDNPAKYHKEDLHKTKPNGWSSKEWKKYKKAHNI